LSGNAFAFAFIALVGGACLSVAIRTPRAAQTVVVLLAVQLALSVYSRSDYLFTRFALTSRGPMPSDVSVMAAALVLPYWFWGALCGALSLLLLWLGARLFFRR
jgi:peptidase M50B-like protein